MADQQAAGSPSGQLPAVPPGILPDLNAEINPFGVVQGFLGKLATFNMISAPTNRKDGVEVRHSGDLVGFDCRQALHRLDVEGRPPTPQAGFRADNRVGPPVGECRFRWLIIPDDYLALPDVEPPPTRFDPARSQRFVMRADFELGNGRQTFGGFGTGLTFPIRVLGKQRLAVGAVGFVSRSQGAFAELQGVFVFNGTLHPSRGFVGSLVARFQDFEGRLTAVRVSPVQAVRNPEPEDSYLLMRYEKATVTGPDGKILAAPGAKTRYAFNRGGLPIGVNTGNPVRLISVGFNPKGPRGAGSEIRLGEFVGEMKSVVTFNILYPAGTAETPSPYRSQNTFSIREKGGRTLGTFRADVVEGRSFAMSLPGLPDQQAVHFGGCGPIGHGTGFFRGIQGMWTDNSAIGISPFASVGQGLYRIFDPEGKYRAALSGGA